MDRNEKGQFIEGMTPLNKGKKGLHHHSAETKEKIRLAGIGRVFSDERKLKISLANKGKIRSEAVNEKNRLSHLGKPSWNKGKHLSEEHIQKLRESHKGKESSFKGKHHSEESIQKIKDARANQIFSDETKLKMSLIHKGNTYCLGKHLSEEHKLKISLIHKGHKYRLGSTITEEHKRIIGLASTGEKNCNWKGGVTPINEKIRKSSTYKEWRTSVYERDDYTCQMCGKKGGRLHAHHIKLFSVYPELRFDINNGITYCKTPCHKTIGLHKGVNKLKVLVA